MSVRMEGFIVNNSLVAMVHVSIFFCFWPLFFYFSRFRGFFRYKKANDDIVLADVYFFWGFSLSLDRSVCRKQCKRLNWNNLSKKMQTDERNLWPKHLKGPTKSPALRI